MEEIRMVGRPKGSGAVVKALFDSLEISERFMVPPDKYDWARVQSSFFGKQLGKKFSVRTTPEGISIWRVS